MNKEFVPYEQALALKELGFDEPCFGYRDGGGYLIIKQMPHCVISTPTFSQAFRWFREKYGLWMTFTYDDCDCEEEDDDCNDCDVCWYIDKCFEYGIGPLFFHDINDFKTLEEAELAGLKKLIEIVKEKK